MGSVRTISSPTYDEIEQSIIKVTKNEVLRIAERIAVTLNHKRLYFMSDVYDIFLYVGGLNHVKEVLTKSYVSPPDELSGRLIEFCYQKVVKKH